MKGGASPLFVPMRTMHLERSLRRDSPALKYWRGANVLRTCALRARILNAIGASFQTISGRGDGQFSIFFPAAIYRNTSILSTCNLCMAQCATQSHRASPTGRGSSFKTCAVSVQIRRTVPQPTQTAMVLYRLGRWSATPLGSRVWRTDYPLSVVGAHPVEASHQKRGWACF